MAKNENKVNEDAAPTAAAATLTTKSAAMSGILAAMASMSHEEMMKWFPDAMQLAADISDGAASQNQASIQMKPSAAVGGAMKEEVDALFEGESLTEEAQTRLVTLIEHAVELRTGVEVARLEEEFQTKLVEEVARVQDELVEKIDTYATYAAEQWVEKNEVAVESAIAVERAARLIEGLASLMKDCGIEIPEEKADVVESLEQKVAELEEKLNETTEDAAALHQELRAKDAMLVFKDVTEGMTAIEVDKFKKLIEDVDIDIDPETLRAKITVIKEAHFKGDRKVTSTGLNEQTVLTEEELTEQENKQDKLEEVTDPRIRRYVEAISRGSNRYARGPYTG